MLISKIHLFPIKMNLLVFSRNRLFKRFKNCCLTALVFYILTILILYQRYQYKQHRGVDATRKLAFDFDVSSTGQDFDFKTDVLALLHIQKTGGSAWEAHIQENLQVQKSVNKGWETLCTQIPKRKRTICALNEYFKPIFHDRYMSRYCDIHADFTELKNCMMFDYKNRIAELTVGLPIQGIVHMMTFLREPIHRYVSEHEHVKREGATWYKAIRTCKTHNLYMRKCSQNETWHHVTWESFLSCEHNLANNRQTRMLANYNLLSCNVLKCWTSEGNCSRDLKQFYERKILQSAKHTLVGLAFFGLTEFPKESEYLFLKTFGENKFRFMQSISTKNETNAQKALLQSDAANYIDRIKENNHLDMELYDFAKQVFFQRISFFKNL